VRNPRIWRREQPLFDTDTDSDPDFDEMRTVSEDKKTA